MAADDASRGDHFGVHIRPSHRSPEDTCQYNPKDVDVSLLYLDKILTTTVSDVRNGKKQDRSPTSDVAVSP